MRILKLFLLTAGLSLLVLASCDLFTLKPEPGSRNYEWTLDTLYMPMNSLYSVWGASPDDVWAVGPGGTQYDRLLHYDGTRWSTYTNEIIWCDGQTLFGFSADDIWMGGNAGWRDRGAGIWHYDGNTWKKYYVYNPDEDYWGIYINDIWGNDPNDVYACGTRGFFDGTNEWLRGFVLHYDGTAWREIARADFNSQFLRIRKEDDKVFVFSYGKNYETGDDDVEFYLVKEDSLVQIYSNKRSEIRRANLTSIDGKTYFTITNNVFLYSNSGFKQVLSINYENYYPGVHGRNKNDMFITMADGIVHYNGTDMQYLYNLPSTNMSLVDNPLILEKDIYYCLWYLSDYQYELILHGRLVEE